MSFLINERTNVLAPEKFVAFAAFDWSGLAKMSLYKRACTKLVRSGLLRDLRGGGAGGGTGRGRAVRRARSRLRCDGAGWADLARDLAIGRLGSIATIGNIV